MGTLIQGILDNDSFFGRLMSKVWIIMAANFLFLLFCLPVITIGPAISALYYVMLEVLHHKKEKDYQVKPFKTFMKGFRMNLKQSLVVWIFFLLFMVLTWIDVRFCRYVGGAMTVFSYAVIAVAFVVLLLTLYLFPVMTAFSDSLPHLIRNAVFFICKGPLFVPVILFFDVFPLYLTYSDPQYMPLYAFLWIMGGFGAVAMIGASLLYPLFKPYLASETEEEMDYSEPDESEEKALEELRMLDGL